jgi:cell division protein FtsA
MAVFALDIGTRKVAGILGELSGGKMRIVDACVREHEKRAMVDGQIHSIEEVSGIVLKIKKELEERNNIVITETVTALAGRNLHTEKTEARINKNGEITRDDLRGLTIECVKKATIKMTEEKKQGYYCVGYSVSHYTLDGQHVKNPLQHFAKENLAVSAIITFLPKITFDSLISVLKNCGLKLTGLTLEPIAAMAVTIPEDMRLLNLALVDVGAGTSDIAITESGKITAYGMIPKAGDEITEVIVNEYLTDFNQAEIIKRASAAGTPLTGSDIFGNVFEIAHQDFIQAVKEKTEEIAADIADEILMLNGRQPRAVVMVGGGSSFVYLRSRVAEKLGLPENRVGSREPGNTMKIENLPEALAGTEGATPLGILDTALYGRGLGFIEVKVNGEKQYIINMEQEIKVMDAIIASGMELKQLYGKPGEAVSFTVNGQLNIVRGGHGEHAKFFVNGVQHGIDDVIKNGDEIVITAVKNGANAAVKAGDLVTADNALTVEVNGRVEKIAPEIYINGFQVSENEAVPDRAAVTISASKTVSEVLSKSGLAIGAQAQERDIIITLNGEPEVLKQRTYQLKLNGMDVPPDFAVKNMDRLEYSDKPSYYRIRDLFKEDLKSKITISINGKPYEIESDRFEITMNGRRAGEDEFIINGASIEIKAPQEPVILSTIFKSYPIDTGRLKGKMLDLKLNGEKAGYTTPIKNGDNVEIRFV